MTMQSTFDRWRTRRWSLKLTLVVIACFGAGLMVSWWLNRPDQPWLVFSDISATYEIGSDVIQVTGAYTATKTCSPSSDPNAADPLEWRQEVKGSQKSPIISYGSQPEAPKLKLGTHPFAQEIPLNEGITPDGWVVSILASCAQDPFAVRSRSVEVEFSEKVE